MEFVIVTGMSGAGKTQAMHAMEDIGFFCVDNLPPKLIPVFYDLSLQSEMMGKVAVVTDARGGELFNSFFAATEALEKEGHSYKILFLDSKASVLVNRYKESRRRHPLATEMNTSLEDAVKLERETLRRIKEQADYVIDTSQMSSAQLKNKISKLFLSNSQDSLRVNCMSFGFKHGIPLEADLVFDVRCLPNPFYDAELRPMTGLDKPVYDYVMEKEETKGFVKRLEDMIDYLIPLYNQEGKSQLIIAIGCTGGQHRSVALAEYMNNHLIERGISSFATHRDMQK